MVVQSPFLFFQPWASFSSLPGGAQPAPFPGDALGCVHCDARPDLRGIPEKRSEERNSCGTSGTFGSASAWEGDQSASRTVSLRSPKGLSEASWSKPFIVGTSVVVQQLGLRASEAGGVHWACSLSCLGAGLLEPPERPQGSPASSSVWREQTSTSFHC